MTRPRQGERDIYIYIYRTLWLSTWKDTKIHTSNRNNNSRGCWFESSNRAPWHATWTIFTPIVCKSFKKEKISTTKREILVLCLLLGFFSGSFLGYTHGLVELVHGSGKYMTADMLSVLQNRLFSNVHELLLVSPCFCWDCTIRGFGAFLQQWTPQSINAVVKDFDNAKKLNPVFVLQLLTWSHTTDYLVYIFRFGFLAVMNPSYSFVFLRDSAVLTCGSIT